MPEHIPGHRVLFVDVGGSGRAVMAAAFANARGLDADAAGTMQGQAVRPQVIVAMQEKGIDVSQEKPVHVEFTALSRYDRIVSMGPGVQQTDPGLPVHEDWRIPSEQGQSVAIVREYRDRIERKVEELVDEMQAWSGMHDRSHMWEHGFAAA
jgi:protein-tyrosine-phosphatase